MARKKNKAHAAKSIRALVRGSNDRFLIALSRCLPPEICDALLRAFGVEGDTAYRLYSYAAEDVKRGWLDLTQCPPLETFQVVQAILLLGGNAVCLNLIRESEDATVLRIVLELLYRLGAVIYLRDVLDIGTDIRRSACHLVDSIMVNSSSSHFSESHIYLFGYSVRSLLCHNKLPRPATIRMQQIEYLLNPLSRFCYYMMLPSEQKRVDFHSHYNGSYGKGKSTPAMVLQASQPHKSNFHQEVAQALYRKYCELKPSKEVVENEIRARATVFEVISRLTERLFGASPYLYGSSACGLASVSSDMDIVVVETRPMTRRLAAMARLWKSANEDDYCPFPAVCRVQVAQQTPRDARDTSLADTDLSQDAQDHSKGKRRFLPFPPNAKRRAQNVGRWAWLDRPTRVIAAIWSGRILALRLARLGWSVECVESARVPILRVVAAVAPDGTFLPVNPKSPSFPTAPKDFPPRFLDPALTVGQCKTWNGSVPDPSCASATKPFSALTESERQQINSAIQRSIDRYMREKICQRDVSISTQSDAPAIYVSADISFNHEVVVHNTRLMKAYVDLDPAVVQLGVLVKHWTKQRGICDAYNGTLSGYQWMLMVIHYLQHFLVQTKDNKRRDIRYFPLLPNLQNPPPAIVASQSQLADGRHDVFFYHPSRGANRALEPLAIRSAVPAGARCVCSNRDSGSPLGSLWPEDLFRNDPYGYARFILLSSADADRRNAVPLPQEADNDYETNSTFFQETLHHMRDYSCPKIEAGYQPATPHEHKRYNSKEAITRLRTDRFVTLGDPNLGTLLQEFFDYFGLRFNTYAYVVSINRTPQLPQSKHGYFNAGPPYGSALLTSDRPNEDVSFSFKVTDTPAASLTECREEAAPERRCCPVHHRRTYEAVVRRFLDEDDVRKDCNIPSCIGDAPLSNAAPPPPAASIQSGCLSAVSHSEDLSVNSALIPARSNEESRLQHDDIECDDGVAGVKCDALDTGKPYPERLRLSVDRETIMPLRTTLPLADRGSASAGMFNTQNAQAPEDRISSASSDAAAHEAPFRIEEDAVSAFASNSCLDLLAPICNVDTLEAFGGRRTTAFEDPASSDLSSLDHHDDEEACTSLSGRNCHDCNSSVEEDNDESDHDSTGSDVSSADNPPALFDELGYWNTFGLGDGGSTGSAAAKYVVLDSLGGSDTISCHYGSQSSDGDNGDEEVNEDILRRKAQKIEHQRALHSARISTSRAKDTFRRRPFLCILDPFEKDRTIGPANRDGFTHIVFELLRARSLFLEAEHRYLTQNKLNVEQLISDIFAPTTEKFPGWAGCTASNLRQSPYRHLHQSNYHHYERAHSSVLRDINDHIFSSVRGLVPHNPLSSAGGIQNGHGGVSSSAQRRQPFLRAKDFQEGTGVNPPRCGLLNGSIAKPVASLVAQQVTAVKPAPRKGEAPKPSNAVEKATGSPPVYSRQTLLQCHLLPKSPPHVVAGRSAQRPAPIQSLPHQNKRNGAGSTGNRKPRTAPNTSTLVGVDSGRTPHDLIHTSPGKAELRDAVLPHQPVSTPPTAAPPLSKSVGFPSFGGKGKNKKQQRSGKPNEAASYVDSHIRPVNGIVPKLEQPSSTPCTSQGVAQKQSALADSAVVMPSLSNSSAKKAGRCGAHRRPRCPVQH